MPPEYPTETHETKSKKKLILVLVLITILIAATTTLGLLYYKTKTNMQSELNSKQKSIGSLEKKNSNYLKQIEALKKTDTAETAEINNTNTHRQIPELGVQYTLNDQTNSLTYAYKGNNIIGFSNIKIADADNPVDSLCLSGLGSVAKAAPSEKSPFGAAGETAEQAAQRMLGNADTKSNVKKVGDSYFFYSPGNQPCYSASPNKAAMEPLITPASRSVVPEALQSYDVSD